MSSAYAMPVHDIQLHTPAGLLHDYADSLAGMASSNGADKSETDALVASGDYFVTLATTLDHLSQSLSAQGLPEHIALERLINDLLYLQRNYRISRKPK